MRPTTGANEHAPGHRQPEETYAREAARPVSQGTPAVRGTWCSEGEAGRHLRTKAGHAGDTPVGQGTPSPVPISQRLERIATQAREYPDMAFTTLAHHLDVAMLAHAFRSLNPQSAPGVDRVTWRTYKNNLVGWQSSIDRLPYWQSRQKQRALSLKTIKRRLSKH